MHTNGQLALDSEEQLVQHPLTRAELAIFILRVPKGRSAWSVLYDRQKRLIGPVVEHDGHVITRAAGELVVEKDGVWVATIAAPTSLIVRSVFNAVERRDERRAKAAKKKADHVRFPGGKGEV